MSYCRFGNDSDVYVYLDVSGYLCCCGCSLKDDWKYFSTDDLLAHLSEHDDAGHDVPPDAIEQLLAERKDNDAWIAAGGPDDH
jgi:hypothetical protein